MELWLKRYLGIFFDFGDFGSLTWLAIPLFVYFLITLKKRRRWEIALVFVFTISFILFSIKAQGYTRYLFTLYPFTLAAIFLCGWEFIKKKNHPFQIGIFIILTLAVFFNYYHSREAYRFLWEYKVSVVDDYFPHELIKYINNAEDFISDSMTLVLSHRHLFFYHTDKKGIDFRDPKLEFFNRQPNKKAALDVLINQLKIKYVYLVWNFKTNFGMTSILSDIISYDCDLIYQDKNGYFLYRIREKKIEKEELEKLFVNDSLLINGSFENWSHGPLNKPDFFEGGDNIFEGMVTREEKETRVGRYSAKITGDNFNFAQDLSNFKDYKGKSLTSFVWVKTNVPDKYRIQIYDGIDSSFSKRYSGRGDWELLQANHTVNPLAKFVLIRVIQAEKTGKVDDVVYVDGALFVEGDWNTFYLYVLHMKKR
jgi:hypothetical protein